jgi:acyl-CoA dehydrogenase
MDFQLSPELTEFGRTIKEWGVETIRPYARQADEEHSLPANAADIVDTCPVPLPRYDRPGRALPSFSDGDGVRDLVFYETSSYCDAWLSEALNAGIGHVVVKLLGNPDQVEKWYEPIAAGGGRTAFGMSEPGAGSDTGRIATTAVRHGDEWVINGTKMYCSLGAVADYTVVFATTDKAAGRSAIKAFVVERDNPGVFIVRANEEKLGLRCWITSQVAFDECVVPAANLLGSADGSAAAASGQSAALNALNGNRPNVSAMSIGFAQAALDTTTELLTEQRASYAPHRWSLVQTQLENMSAALNRSRRLNYVAQWNRSYDGGSAGRRAASIAKAYGPPTSERVIRYCMHLLGPEGTSKELLLEKWYRDVKILDIFEGTGQIMKMLISRDMMGRAAAA